MSIHRHVVFASFILFGGGCATSPPPATPTTPGPASFTEQVSAGQKLYGANCASCHGDSGEGTDKGPRLVGLDKGALPLDPPPERQLRKTKFETVGDVATFVVGNMPPKKAGTLSSIEYWSILAFDLHANGIDLPAPLTPEVASTLKIPR
jgi:mono/diheme cytochrome c family protein